MNFHAIILAAGAGKRMGIKEKKQFLMVKDKAIFIHSLLAFARTRDIKHIVCVYNEEDYQRYKILIDRESGLVDRVKLVPGGEERSHSVMQGLEHLKEISQSDDYVLIHDGARPLVTQKDITSLIETLKEPECKGATLGYKISDTIKEVDEQGFIKKNVPRKKLWGIMTPQGFHLDTIYQAHKNNKNEKVTDDTELLISKNENVKIVESSKQNLKLTTKEDLALIELYFKVKQLKIESPF